MLLIVVLILANIYILCQTGKNQVFAPKVQGPKKWTVYGTMTCKWTRKQLEYLNDTKRHYVFINCNEESCDNTVSYTHLTLPTILRV